MKRFTENGILVACVGNIFLGDDGFGCEVARALGRRHLAHGTKVIDYGIRSLDLAYDLLEPLSAVILVDAVSQGGPPGTVYLLQPLSDDAPHPEEVLLNAHVIGPTQVLSMARRLGRVAADIYVVGCEPQRFENDEGQMGLSETVSASVPEAVRTILELLENLNRQEVQHAVPA